MSDGEMLDCPECGTPAIPASSVINGRPSWTEDDPEVWCPGMRVSPSRLFDWRLPGVAVVRGEGFGTCANDRRGQR